MMPELPEVEYTARQLRATIVGATIAEAMVFWERTIGYPSVTDFCAEIAVRRIEGVRRRAKFLLLDLSGNLFLSLHRRMTGNLLLLPPGWVVDTSLRTTDPLLWNVKGPTFTRSDEHEGRNAESEQAQRETNTSAAVVVQARVPDATRAAYCRVCFNLTDGRRLLFTDPRKFGRIELWPCDSEAQVFAHLGPEPLSSAFTVEQLAQALARRKMSIKQALLAQDVVAGVGNIYADEALFFAGIYPLRSAASLSLEEVKKLHEGIGVVLTRGIEHGGTSFNDYRDLWGEAGENYNHVRVYQRDGQPCETCGTAIERIVIAQRSAHYCPHCQPEHNEDE
jgi:formamidopyrimidine-DNA glycosylase